MPVNQQPINNFSAQSPANPTKKVGILLGIGILFIPYIFSWFTLQKGYSTLAKAISFGWLGIVVLMFIVTPKTPQSSNSPATSLSSSSSTTSSTSTVSTPNESPKKSALRQAKLDYSWGKGGFDSVMEADFTIENPSNYTIKDIEITCTHFANSGTEIDSNTRTIYESVPAKGKKVIKDFNMGFIHSQAKKTSCKIEDLEVEQ